MDVVKIARSARVAREVKLFQSQPPWGITCRPEKDDCLDSLCVILRGPRGSPYELGCFKIIVNIPERYPFEPPLLKFVTPVYHPNIDKGGRICMDMLKMPPKGGWVPTITLETLLVSLQTLLGNPNPDDPLMLEVAQEFKNNKDLFIANAKKHTAKHALKSPSKILKSIQQRSEELSAKRAKYKAMGFKIKEITREEAIQEYKDYINSQNREDEAGSTSQNDGNKTTKSDTVESMAQNNETKSDTVESMSQNDENKTTE